MAPPSGHYAYVASYDGSSLAVVDVGGADVPTANIGDLAASSIETMGNIQSANNIIADGGLNVGPGGIKSDGPMAVTGGLRLTPSPGTPTAANLGEMYCGSDGKLHFYNGTSRYSLDMTAD